MAPKKQTTSQLEAKIDTMAKDIKEFKSMNHRITMLEQWKVSEDAYKAAFAKVKQEEEDNKYTKLRDGEIKKRTEVLKQIGIIAAIVIAILYAYSATHGIKVTP